MAPTLDRPPSTRPWTPVPDGDARFSSGIPDLDRLVGGGLPRGGFALYRCDERVTPEDLDLCFTPLFLNFLYQSRGILAVLPPRDSPKGFRSRLTRFATRRRFDSRVRIVEYVGEDDESPYVVSLKDVRAGAADRRKRADQMARMQAAERAVRGGRARPFLEFNALEVAEVLFGVDAAAKMFFHGVKRARMVGNLVVGLLRPGLGCSDAVRAMSDVELALYRDDVGLLVRGIRPAFPGHLMHAQDPGRSPLVGLVPRP